VIAMAARLSTAHTVIKRSRMLNPLLPPDYWWPARVPAQALEAIVRAQSSAALAMFSEVFDDQGRGLWSAKARHKEEHAP